MEILTEVGRCQSGGLLRERPGAECIDRADRWIPSGGGFADRL